MQIYCSYNQALYDFLNKVVGLILDKYGTQLNISSLEEIELINKKDLPYETDGKVLSKSKIIVTSRLYELLPTLTIGELNDNNDYLMLRKTLYHEMGHINDMELMPKLYDCVLEGFNNRKVNAECISSLIWIEYIAEKRTATFENVYNLEICDELVTKKWHCSIANPYSHYGERNFFYLTKVLPYFIARTGNEDKRSQYLSQIENKFVVDYIKEIDTELNYLESKETFDDPRVLRGLDGIIDKYLNIFMNNYGR